MVAGGGFRRRNLTGDVKHWTKGKVRFFLNFFMLFFLFYVIASFPELHNLFQFRFAYVSVCPSHFSIFPATVGVFRRRKLWEVRPTAWEYFSGELLHLFPAADGDKGFSGGLRLFSGGFRRRPEAVIPLFLSLNSVSFLTTL